MYKPDPGAMRIVVADDNSDAADLLTILLESEGHAVATVYDGAAAVHAALRIRADLALLDINMPVKTGDEAATEIQAKAPRTLLIAISALPPHPRIRAQFHDYVLKPFDVPELLQRIRELKMTRDAACSY